MSDLQASGITAELHGSGSPVVMLHGLGGTSNSFEPMLAALGTYRVIRPDLPGAGRSALPPGKLTLTAVCSALAQFLKLIGVARAHFIGHSMGTLICQQMALDSPGLVASLTLFGALSEPGEAAREGLRQRARDVLANGMSETADAIVRHSLGSHTAHESPAAAAFVRESLMRQSPAGYAANCEMLAAAQAVRFERIACPVQIVTGRDDPVTPPSMGQGLADRHRHASIRILERCGHWTPIEKPLECRAAVQQFLPAISL